MNAMLNLCVGCLVFVVPACKTRSSANLSGERGDVSDTIISQLMPESTPESVRIAVQKRLDNLNEYTSNGDLATQSNCPSSESDPCGLVNIFVEFENPGSSSVGHSALSVATPLLENGKRFHQFYDFGPGTDTIDGRKVKVGDPGIFALPKASAGVFSGMHGTQWWDNPENFEDLKTPSEIGVNQILSHLNRIAGDHTVIRIPICVSKAHQALINRYWVRLYMDMPTYRIPGNHCTSMVAQSFETTLGAAKRIEQPSILSWTADQLDMYVTSPRDITHWITSPSAYADRVLKSGASSNVDYRHQCGKLKGAIPRAVVVQTESLFQDDHMAPFVKWTTDTSFPQ